MLERLDRFIKTDDQKLKEAEEIIGLLKDSPAVEQRRRERDAQRVAKIRELLAKRDELERERAGTLPKLQTAVTEAEEREKRALAAVKVATAEKVAAASELSNKGWWFNHQIDVIAAAVRNLAPRCIGESIFELNKLETQTRNSVRSEVRQTKKNIFTDRLKERFFSNIKSVERRVALIREARKTAEALRFEPLTETEIIKRLEKLKNDLPPLDEYDEITDVQMPDVSELRKSTL